MKWNEYLWRVRRAKRGKEKEREYAMVDVMGKRKENGEKERRNVKYRGKIEGVEYVRTSVGVCATWWRNQDIRAFFPKKVLRNYASRSK